MKSVASLDELKRRALSTGATVEAGARVFNAQGAREDVQRPPLKAVEPPPPPPPDPVLELARAVMAQSAAAAESARETGDRIEELARALSMARPPAPTPSPTRGAYSFEVRRDREGLIESVIATPINPVTN